MVRGLQVLSLNARDDRVSAYLPEIDEYVRRRLSARLVKPLDLVITARIKARCVVPPTPLLARLAGTSPAQAASQPAD